MMEVAFCAALREETMAALHSSCWFLLVCEAYKESAVSQRRGYGVGLHAFLMCGCTGRTVEEEEDTAEGVNVVKIMKKKIKRVSEDFRI